MDQRNESICAYYAAGHKLSECASHFKMGRQRVQQILQAAGVWKPYVKNGRDQFLGLTLSSDAKDALRQEAAKRGISMSELSAEAIAQMLARQETT